MRTLRILRIEELVGKCENELTDIACILQVTLDNFCYGKIKAAQARKIYFKQIGRAKFYCQILQKLLKAGNLSTDGLDFKYMSDFSDYILFFEG